MLSDVETDYPYIRVTDFQNYKVTKENIKYIEKETYEKIKRYIINKEDTYISIAGSIGKVGTIPLELDGSNLTENAAKIKTQYYVNKLMAFFLSSNYGQRQISRYTIHTNQPKLALFRIKKISIPMPPLAEQQRIVNKIEELFTNLDKGIEYLKTAQTELKITRQAVLKYALEGKLTEDWREKHKDEIEPASVLLEKIKAERRREGKYKDLPPIDTSGNTNLPEGWAWARLGEAISIEYGKGLTKDKRDKNGKYPVYGSNGIVGYHSDYYVEKNCIVIGRKGAVGKVHLTNSPCWPIDTTYYTISPKELSMNFLFYLLSHLRLEKLDKSTAIPGINRNDVYSKVIILPPLEEQHKIVEEIETYYSILDNMESTISHSLNQTSGIRQSILKKAFEGRLVPQDPNDESASILLERIRAEKSKNEREKKLEKKNRFVKEQYRQMRIE
jgi:type I restriction enzyme S subunit